MTALQDVVLWGINEVSCARCILNYREDSKAAPCLTNGPCLKTKRPRAKLSWQEYRILDAVYLYMDSGMIDEKLADQGELIARLGMYTRGLVKEREANG